MSDHSITSLIEKLEAASEGSRELDCRIMAVFDRVDGEAWTAGDLEIALEDPDRTVNPPHFTTSLDAALALAERVVGGKEALLLLTDLLTRESGASDFDLITVSDLPRLLCAAVLRAQSEAR